MNPMDVLFETRHYGKPIARILVTLVGLAGPIALMVLVIVRAIDPPPYYSFWGELFQQVPTAMAFLTALFAVPQVRLRVYEDRLEIARGFLFLLKSRIDPVNIDRIEVHRSVDRNDNEKWKGYRRMVYIKGSDAIAIVEGEKKSLVGCEDAVTTANSIRSILNIRDKVVKPLKEESIPESVIEGLRTAFTSPMWDPAKPIYEKKYKSSLTVYVFAGILLAMMLIAGIQYLIFSDLYFAWLILGANAVVFLMLMVMAAINLPVFTLRIYKDRLVYYQGLGIFSKAEIGYGDIRDVRLVDQKITVRDVIFTQEFAETWKGWKVVGHNRKGSGVGVITDERNYLLGISDPEDLLKLLKAVMVIRTGKTGDAVGKE